MLDQRRKRWATIVHTTQNVIVHSDGLLLCQHCRRWNNIELAMLVIISVSYWTSLLCLLANAARDDHPRLAQCWASVTDDVPTLEQLW